MSEGPRDSSTERETDPAAAGESKPPRRRRWPLRLGITAVVLLAIYTIVGVFVVPMVVQRAIVPRVAEQLTGDITIEEISCNPFTLGLELRGVTVTEASGEKAVEVARIAGNFDLIETTFNYGYWFNHLRVFEPVVHAEIDERGRRTVLDLDDAQDAEQTDA
ncbi:MAG: hypothetical protein ACOC3G_03875, partial [Phycisphaeraceae bacterium]